MDLTLILNIFLLFLHATPTPRVLEMKLNSIENIMIHPSNPLNYRYGNKVGHFRIFLHVTSFPLPLPEVLGVKLNSIGNITIHPSDP